VGSAEGRGGSVEVTAAALHWGSRMRIVTFFLVCLLSLTAVAQQARNAAYFELGGNAIAPSVNYERQFTERWYGRVGLTVVSSSESGGDSDTTYGIPVMVGTFTRPAGNHHFETAAGLLFITGDSQDFFDDEDDEEINNVAGTITLGYRYQKPGRGFVFRAGFTPIFDTSGILPWAGVSFGYAW
jgi:hypothetical protein